VFTAVVEPQITVDNIDHREKIREKFITVVSHKFIRFRHQWVLDWHLFDTVTCSQSNDYL